MSTDIPVSDSFQPVPGVKYEDEQVVVPEAPKEPEKLPEPTAEPEVQEPAKPEAEPVKERPQKAKPIADLLSKKHELETQLEAERAAKAELEAKLAQLSQQPNNATTDDEIKALAEETGIDEGVLAKIVGVARKGVNPQLPKEVQDLLAERQAEKVQQEELKAFNKRVDSLAKALPAEFFADPQVKEKLLELAYSTEKAPDGEPYHQKELSELYFAYIKPEIEPGKTSAEPSRGGTQSTKVIDFQEIFDRDDPKDIDNMDSETFNKYNDWIKAKQGRSPIIRKT